jgi:hypothetical protein
MTGTGLVFRRGNAGPNLPRRGMYRKSRKSSALRSHIRRAPMPAAAVPRLAPWPAGRCGAAAPSLYERAAAFVARENARRSVSSTAVIGPHRIGRFRHVSMPTTIPQTAHLRRAYFPVLCISAPAATLRAKLAARRHTSLCFTSVHTPRPDIA